MKCRFYRNCFVIMRRSARQKERCRYNFWTETVMCALRYGLWLCKSVKLASTEYKLKEVVSITGTACMRWQLRTGQDDEDPKSPPPCWMVSPFVTCCTPVVWSGLTSVVLIYSCIDLVAGICCFF
jgi:hypothetical protein